MNPKIGEFAVKENREEIKEILKGSDLVFVASGFGGGTGTGASPVVSQIAKNGGALTVAIITTPFSFEGLPRQRIAEKGLESLRNKVDSLVVVANDKLLKMVTDRIPVSSAFYLCDEILQQAVQSISDLISFPGIVNLDFADLKTVMKNSGRALFGVGRGRDENRVKTAVNSALNSPFLEDISLKKGRAALVNVTGGRDLALSEIQEAVRMIGENLAKDAKIIFGATEEKILKEGEIKVAVFITGFEKT